MTTRKSCGSFRKAFQEGSCGGILALAEVLRSSARPPQDLRKRSCGVLQMSCGGLAEVLWRSCGGLAEVLRRSCGVFSKSCGVLQRSCGGLAEVLRRSCGGPCGGLAEVLRRSLSTLHLESTSIISVLVCHALWFGVCLQKKHKFEGHMNQTLGHLRVKCDFQSCPPPPRGGPRVSVRRGQEFRPPPSP